MRSFRGSVSSPPRSWRARAPPTMHTMPATRTYQGASLEEPLPQIPPDLGEVAARQVAAGDWEQVSAQLLDAGMPADVVEALVSDAVRLLAPFDPDAREADLVRQMLARTVRVEHGWHSKSRTIAVVGPAGAGKRRRIARPAHALRRRAPF